MQRYVFAFVSFILQWAFYCRYQNVATQSIYQLFMLTVVDCEEPADMSNATVSYIGTTFEEIVNYTCEVGFMFPNGAKLLVSSCSDLGNWTGPNETCEG